MDASTGDKQWSYKTGGKVESSPSGANGVVYIGSDDGKVYALDARTGAKLRSYTTGNYVLSSPVVVKWGGVCRLVRQQRVSLRHKARVGSDAMKKQEAASRAGRSWAASARLQPHTHQIPEHESKPMPRSRKINLQKVHASLDAGLPTMREGDFTPPKVRRIDFEQMECPACGERLAPDGKRSTVPPASR